ncbi:ABC transporter ATP-binding protein [Natronorubrum tibetense]|uniref:Peptide ABC transporter ATPase n=1 Tax=Natronorubrum tibetense GA33 TaxID=1114856 RepID=L9W159_9EURY|nr:oligopeptide/dipeptide ABC transporter ATP-binding protein [Natronorubrum tibetense]ELY43011.1 peptide ABC transporter ATPase [Natronorubrum tibetense GA33]
MIGPETGSNEEGRQDGETETESNAPPLLEVEALDVHYPITKGLLRREVGRVRAVDGVSFDITRGETFGLVGESGSGKTTTAHSVLGLEEPTGGEIRFDGEPVSELSGAALQAFRRRAQLVVQDPNEAFNPRMTIGEAVAEPLLLHGMTDADRRRAIVEDLLERVGLSAPDADRYPHEFSGGEKQRLSIARALVLNPDLIVADEPTSALDGRVQSDVLALLDDVRREFDISILFISHDIDVVRRFCDRVAVMYLGEVVERGPIENVLEFPAHPYTRLLLGSVPSLDPTDQQFERPLTDTVPDPADPPSGCRFHTRCPEIVPPESVELPWDQWMVVVAFRFTLQAGELPESIAVETADGELDDATVRDRFDLPATLQDETVDRGVNEAISALITGDLQAARDRLSETVPTVCERQTPTDTEREPGHSVCCHRYDPAIEAEPRSWVR